MASEVEHPVEIADQVREAVADALPDALDAALPDALDAALPAALSDAGASLGGAGGLDDQAVGDILDALAAINVAEVFILAALLLVAGLLVADIFTGRLSV